MEMNNTNDWQITVKIPKTFWADHESRECVQDAYRLDGLAKHYRVSLTEADLLELLDDAHHYASSADAYGWDMQYLVSSARATRNAIIKQVGAERLAEMWVRHGKHPYSARQMRLPIESV